MSDEEQTTGEPVEPVEAVETVEMEPGQPSGGGLTGRKIAAIAVAVVLVAGFVVGLIASKHQKDDEQKASVAPVATVDGVHISKRALDAEVHTWTANKDYVAAAKQQGETMVDATGQPAPAFERDILTQQIEDVLFTREFHRRHLKVTAADETQLRSEVAQNPALAKYPKPFLDSIVERAARVQVLQAALTTPPTDAQIQKAYNDQYVCASGRDVAHILVNTLAEANAIEAQLASGANFATLAQQKSTDTGSKDNGGSYGCLKRGTFVKPFEDAAFAAKFGQPTAPVKSQFGYHIILVTPHHDTTKPPPLASVREQIVQQLEQTPTQFNTFVDRMFGQAKVTIDPSLGSWQRTSQGYAVEPLKRGTAPSTATSSGSAATTAPPPVVDGRPHAR